MDQAVRDLWHERHRCLYLRGPVIEFPVQPSLTHRSPHGDAVGLHLPNRLRANHSSRPGIAGLFAGFCVGLPSPDLVDVPETHLAEGLDRFRSCCTLQAEVEEPRFRAYYETTDRQSV